MLKSYEAIYNHGQLHWLNDKPDTEQAQVIVTIVEPTSSETTQSADAIQSLLAETRGAWGTGLSLDDIDRDIAKMRDEWLREWDLPDRKSEE